MEEYLNTLLEQIRCRKARPFIRQELKDHLEDQIEENMHAGMERELAEKEAVRDMGDPVETGISLDRIHRPQMAWKLLFMITLISAVGVLTHLLIAGRIEGSDASASGRYAVYVMIGIAVMFILYFLDYTLLAGFSDVIAVLLMAMCLQMLLFGYPVNGMKNFLFPGGVHLAIQALMLFYVPVYGGIVYRYRGMGYTGLLKSAVWMICPVVLVWRLPAAMTAGLMLISMLVMLTKAIQKDWFVVQKKKATAGLWGIFTVLPAALFLAGYFGNGLADYQRARLRAFLSNSSDANYITATLRSLLKSCKLVGSSGADVPGRLPAFNSDYILSYLSSVYGMLAAIFVCCILAVLILAVFGAALKQKNQLGMIMGCGCGMIFLVNALINILENLGAFPATATYLPFLSAGGSYTVASYGLMGIVLSIYRYRNVYPRHVKIRSRKEKTQGGMAGS